jgi:anti-sigma B factor antagonist
MQISERRVRGVTILDLEGRFVLEDGVAEFVQRMNALSREARRRILLNFQQVTYLDSAGVGAIAWKYVTVRKRDGDVKLLNLRRRTHNVLMTTKLLSVIEAFESEELAIDSFHDEPDDSVDPIFT